MDCTHVIEFVATGAVAAFLLKKALENSKRVSVLPPGPPATWPWASPIPHEFAHQALAEWTTQYGPVFSIQQGRNVTIVVGRIQAAIDILEKHGGITLSRPDNVPAGVKLSDGKRMLLTPSGELHRRMRKAVHEPLQPGMVKSYSLLQFKSAKQYISNILNKPELHQHHAELYAATIILKITYGKSAPSSFEDPDVRRIHTALDRLNEALKPGTYVADQIPFLWKVPGYAKELTEWHAEELTLFREQVDKTRVSLKDGSDDPSFVRYLLENPDVHGLDEDSMAYLAGTLYGAGADTTFIAMSTTILAAACHPEAQAKVMEEIDQVIGNRLPTPEDMHTLPQLDAFIQEALRWRPVITLGIQHKSTADMVWNGYHIPAGATIIGNHWALSRDPDAFPDPDKFDPQRWINDKGSLKSPSEIRFFTFGFGRRVCPGQHVALKSLFVTMSMLFWAFRVSQDPSKPINPEAYEDKLISHPLPFHAKFEPRRSVKEIEQALAD
ncbi:cytochrome P450 [Coniophora puteana RWD-64-598 SS2]|uniref:Cytochrome P450 n=1 Tax=Coniophora puteana (strain RWD-64-598) TaxID=741705 RepID=A0A5M3N4A5_CONPW|nr:cytochrome P450 [Coniophora puteana RWD-64-598 SS2]EIW86087.1 cytochrome P450 [Coniophora puteana RWD-64-598 SS2]